MTRRDRTLHVGPAHAASLEEAVARLVADDYGTIVLHRSTAEGDAYGLVAYLAGTWPDFLRAVTIRSVSRDGASATWSASAGRFVRETPPPLPRPRLVCERGREDGRREAAV